jgi:hypothetical protein
MNTWGLCTTRRFWRSFLRCKEKQRGNIVGAEPPSSSVHHLQNPHEWNLLLHAGCANRQYVSLLEAFHAFRWLLPRLTSVLNPRPTTTLSNSKRPMGLLTTRQRTRRHFPFHPSAKWFDIVVSVLADITAAAAAAAAAWWCYHVVGGFGF